MSDRNPCCYEDRLRNLEELEATCEESGLPWRVCRDFIKEFKRHQAQRSSMKINQALRRRANKSIASGTMRGRYLMFDSIDTQTFTDRTQTTSLEPEDEAKMMRSGNMFIQLTDGLNRPFGRVESNGEIRGELTAEKAAQSLVIDGFTMWMGWCAPLVAILPNAEETNVSHGL